MGDRLEQREAAHSVAAKLRFDVDVVDDLRREDPAVPEDVAAVRFGFVCQSPVYLLEHELAFSRLEQVVVVKHLAAHKLLELRRRAEPIDRELAPDQLRVRVRPLARHTVNSQGTDLARDIDDAVIHGVAEAGSDVAADDLATALHHEARHRAGVAEHNDRASLLIDSGASADLSLYDEVT